MKKIITILLVCFVAMICVFADTNTRWDYVTSDGRSNAVFHVTEDIAAYIGDGDNVRFQNGDEKVIISLFPDSKVGVVMFCSDDENPNGVKISEIVLTPNFTDSNPDYYKLICESYDNSVNGVKIRQSYKVMSSVMLANNSCDFVIRLANGNMIVARVNCKNLWMYV